MNHITMNSKNYKILNYLYNRKDVGATIIKELIHGDFNNYVVDNLWKEKLITKKRVKNRCYINITSEGKLLVREAKIRQKIKEKKAKKK